MIAEEFLMGLVCGKRLTLYNVLQGLLSTASASQEEPSGQIQPKKNNGNVHGCSIFSSSPETK